MAKKRRTQAEMCVVKKKERGKQYKRRSRALEVLTNPKIQGSKRVKAERDRKRADKSIYAINHYLFKCTKKYSKLRTQKRSIQQKKSRLRSELPSLNKRDKSRQLRKIRKLVEKENALDLLMGKDVFMTKGKVTFKEDAEKGTVEQVIPAWVLGEEVQDKLLSGLFDTITIDGVEYNIADTGVLIIMGLVSDIVVDIISKQDETRTPMALFGFNEEERSFYIGTGQW